MFKGRLSMKKSRSEVNDFVKYLQDEGKKKNTIDTYKKIIESFAEWLEQNGGELDELTRFDVQLYIKHLEGNGRSPSTVDKVFACIRVFTRFIGELDVTDNIQRIKPKSKKGIAPKSLNRLEKNQLLRDVEKDGNLRNIAIIYTLLYTGVRPTELSYLEKSQLSISERKGSIEVRKTKNGQERIIPLAKDLRYHLQRYLDSRTDELEPLFISNFKKRISRQTIYDVVNKYGIHPYVLRHTFARQLISKGTDLMTVAYLMGHSDINTTKIYTSPRHDEIEDAINNAFL